MEPRKWTGLAIAALAVTMAGAALAAGGQGSESNPLVSLSYLNEVAVPEMMAQVDNLVNERMEKLQGASFQALDLNAGQVLTLSAGTQLLFRGGTAEASPDLTDLTAGISTGIMTENHLYLAAGGGQKVTASTACTVMVLGGYALS